MIIIVQPRIFRQGLLQDRRDPGQFATIPKNNDKNNKYEMPIRKF